MGATINARMGLNTWAAFFGTDANAEIAGDVAMLAQEVTPVLKALRASGLNVVAIHNHMTSGAPTVYFLHYWAPVLQRSSPEVSKLRLVNWARRELRTPDTKIWLLLILRSHVRSRNCSCIFSGSERSACWSVRVPCSPTGTRRQGR